MKFNKFLTLSLTVLFLLLPTFLTAKEEKQKLTGSVVKSIVEQFVSMHYSQKPLNDDMSSKIFFALHEQAWSCSLLFPCFRCDWI